MDLHPGDGVFGGIEIGGAAQHFGGDAIFANLCVMTLEVLFADVLEQFDQPLGAREGWRGENCRELQTFRIGNSGEASSSVIDIRHL